MRNKKRILGLSVVTALLLGSSAFAGKIITDADSVAWTQNKQFGFGGWNFDNVNVRIVDVNDFAGNIGDFNTTTGIYAGLVPETSFESDIKDTVSGTIMGHLHGKDYPVGEPAGIKIINDDNVGHGKPNNCIMTSSYLDTGYLDSATPNPVICSSDFQTHKRYKINMLPSSIATIDVDGYGLPIDLVFNLDSTDTNATVRRYQVLQKANNYTGVRLDGYKVEVLDENGTANDALTLSLGLGEGVDENGTIDGSDIWGESDMANFSHGLWGGIDKHFDAPGFFDSTRGYYTVALSETNQSISYIGDMLGGNYQAIFGNWLPDIWEPQGVFHDDDNDPETDGVLLAFFGKAPGFTEDAWYKNSVDITDPKKPVYTWSLATETDFAAWTGDLYSVGGVEDVLNLGLNYIINVGENAAIGKTFTLRITPHVALNQTPPTYVSKDSSIPTSPPTDPTDPTVPPVVDPGDPSLPGFFPSSSGGGCTYNPNSKNFDMTFLLIMGLGLLYPFRRRFLK